MDFQQSVKLVMETHGKNTLLDIDDTKAAFEKRKKTVTFTRLRELEERLTNSYGTTYDFIAYQSNQYNQAFGEMEVHLTIENERYVFEMNFWSLDTDGEVSTDCHQFRIEEGELELSSTEEKEEYWVVIRTCPGIEKHLLAFAENLPAYRLYFATGHITIE